ncbi:NAD(P)/FAD-dependent oxidoreductase [Nonomuraea lactucae]|uniref:NAD(P)/FAD-dependent oxidoreductase n=1 Tax=Nonomuraea lactucae TaxID=2249762 RepID=UPI0019642E5B|nr:FAD/NAD(P)-binding oxidoreductase [Nonomuraea lactucae]
MKLKRIVVVGGSIAALTAVETLRLEGFDGSITVLSDEKVPPYTRVPLSKSVLAGLESEDDLTLPAMSDDVDLRLHVRAEGLDVHRRVVHTSAGSIPFDGLVIATGARARTVGHRRGGERVLRDIEHSRSLRADLATASSVLVVGGGFLGMETASTCRQLGKDVTVVDREPPLERLLGPLLAARIRDAARKAGVRIRVAAGDVELVGEKRPSGARIADDEVLEADIVVSAVGDLPNIEWLLGSGLSLNGGVHVDAYCRARPNIVAAGDVAVQAGPDGLSRRTPSWTNAVEQARAAAQALLRAENAAPYRPSHYYWTEQFGLDVKMVGPPGSNGTPTISEGSLDRPPALLEWRTSGTAYRVVALNHAIRAAQLKRLVPAHHSRSVDVDNIVIVR